jgi:hypothetical protein
MVNGRWLLRDRRSLTLDPVSILVKAREYEARVRAAVKPQ